MNNGSFSICVHILTLLSHFEGGHLSSDFIAGSININPVMVRKEIAKLKKAGLVESKEGKSGGTRLVKPPKQITMRDIMVAVKEPGTFLLNIYKNEPNPKCEIGSKIEEQLYKLYREIDQEALDKLASISLADFHRQFA